MHQAKISTFKKKHRRCFTCWNPAFTQRSGVRWG